MTQEGGFRMSQGLDVLSPRADKAYPIPCDEWDTIKERVQRLSNEPWLFHTVGSLLLGAAVSTFVSILLGTYSAPAQERARILAWSVVVVTFLCGVLCLYFATKERGVERERASDIVTQMKLIERRFDRAAA